MRPIHCANCNELIGFVAEACPLPSIICVPCETERRESGDEMED